MERCLGVTSPTSYPIRILVPEAASGDPPGRGEDTQWVSDVTLLAPDPPGKSRRGGAGREKGFLAQNPQCRAPGRCATGLLGLSHHPM